MSGLDWTDLSRALSVLALAVSGAVWLHTYLVNRERATAQDIRGLDVRMTVIEAGYRVLPTQGSVHEMNVRVAEIAGELKAMNARLRGQGELLERIERTVMRHEDHMLSRGGE